MTFISPNLKTRFFAATVLMLACASCQDFRTSAYDQMLKALLSHSVRELTVNSVGHKPDTLLLDTRSYSEYAVSHIPGAVWVGYDDFSPERVAGYKPEEPIILYCSVGYRSEKVAEQLQALGFETVYNLYGGIFSWVNTGRTVVDLQGQPTQKVHAFDKEWGIWLEKGEKVYE